MIWNDRRFSLITIEVKIFRYLAQTAQHPLKKCGMKIQKKSSLFGGGGGGGGGQSAETEPRKK